MPTCNPNRLAVQEMLARRDDGLVRTALLWRGEANEPLGRMTEWVVDPIDGTTNFIRGPTAQHLVALLGAQSAGAGCGLNPYANKMFAAGRVGLPRLNRSAIVFQDPFCGRVGADGHHPHMTVKRWRVPPLRRAAVPLRAADLRRSGSLQSTCGHCLWTRRYFSRNAGFPPGMWRQALMITKAGGTFVHAQLANTGSFRAMASSPMASAGKRRWPLQKA